MYNCWSDNFGTTVLSFRCAKARTRQRAGFKREIRFLFAPFYLFISLNVKLLLSATVHYLTPTNNHDYSSFVVRRECQWHGSPDGNILGENRLIGFFSGTSRSCSRSCVRSHDRSWFFHCWSYHRVAYSLNSSRRPLSSWADSPSTPVYPANNKISHGPITQICIHGREMLRPNCVWNPRLTFAM